MKIVVATIGSRGDVQPYINLCQGLQAAGHDVTLATNATLCSLAEAHGIKVVPVGQPLDMGAEGARLLAQSFDNMWMGLIRVMQLGARLVEEAYPDVLEVCKSADLVITSDTGSGVAEAEKLGKPWLSVTLQPARVPMAIETPTFIGRIFGWTIGKLLVAPTNRFRRRVGAPLVEDLTTMLSRRMILLPVSPRVAPPNPKWATQLKQTAYWYARPVVGWTPPLDLIDFIKAGDKPVAVSLGAMSASQAHAGARMVLAAIRQTGVRAIVQGWGELLKEMEVPSTIYSADSLPHSWLFDQVSLVVHHGGFGTTAAALRGGIPAVVIPHVIDQYYWGQRVFELGVGPKFVSRGNLTSEKLARAMTQALTDANLRAKADQLGKLIRHEPDGVTQAVQLIERAS